MTSDEVEEARKRGARWADHLSGERQSLRQQAEVQYNVRPITPLCLMDHVARILPEDAAVVEESPTTTGCHLERIGALKNTTGYFAQRGWALGWGLNCAIGVQLAWPDRPVLAIIGDGSALYGIQGLWTAARYRLPVTFLVTNNTEYRILKQCARVLELPNALAGRYVGLEVVDPAVDYVGLAQSLGVRGCRLTEPDEVSQALQESLAGEEPRLVEVPVRHPNEDS
jgi:benzoylformate decarboxylase